MNYEMGEPCELPATKCCSEKLEPSVALFRWKGQDGGWKIGRAFMVVRGCYLMQDVDGLHLVACNAVEIHPNRDELENDAA